MKDRCLVSLLFGALFMLSAPVIAAPTSTTINNKPINIDADNQQIDIKNNTITFSGNVQIEQDNFKITAERVVISHIQNKDEQRVTAYGEPVKFKQTMVNNKIVSGHATQLDYDIKSHTITLTGDAELNQQDNVIRSQVIAYNINQQQILAKGNGSTRVRTTIIPNQITEINK
ncbi:MAG: lipopolysaccharide transport periplasmic protein LptA [Candidatus Schmidhempelia sp.]|nr:lipopolysaccharide transport periplasmic protein LptA [Candidatus Schmidhempelia sp.]